MSKTVFGYTVESTTAEELILRIGSVLSARGYPTERGVGDSAC